MCFHTDVHEIDQLWPILNKEILVYEQGILLLTLLMIDRRN